MTLNDAIASSMLKNSCYDAILTHNVEASVVAGLLGMLRPRTRIPLVYCVHTLMLNELSTYSKPWKNKEILLDFERIKESGGRSPRSKSRIAKQRMLTGSVSSSEYPPNFPWLSASGVDTIQRLFRCVGVRPSAYLMSTKLLAPYSCSISVPLHGHCDSFVTSQQP